MSPPTASYGLPETNVIPTAVRESEIHQDRAFASHPRGSMAVKEPPKGTSTNRLKITFKREFIARETRSINSQVSRAGRIIKPPTAYAPAPTAVVVKRKRATRKKDANIICVHCQRGNSPNTNVIVFCDRCNATWHQKCHDPPIDNEVIKVVEAEWFCHKCKPAPQRSAGSHKSPKIQKQSQTHPRLQHGPQLDVGGDHFTADETRAYLSSLSHAALVELLVKVSTDHPTVRMFPANMRELPASKFPAPPAATAHDMATNADVSISVATSSKKRTHSAYSASAEHAPGADHSAKPGKRARTTSTSVKPSATQTSLRTKGKTRSCAHTATSRHHALTHVSASNPPPLPTETISASPPELQGKPLRLRLHLPDPEYSSHSSSDESEPETEDDELEEIEDHRLYPRAGNGFLASADPADLNILDEDSGCLTFSHGIHGPAEFSQVGKVPVKIWSQRLRK